MKSKEVHQEVIMIKVKTRTSIHIELEDKEIIEQLYKSISRKLGEEYNRDKYLYVSQGKVYAEDFSVITENRIIVGMVEAIAILEDIA